MAADTADGGGKVATRMLLIRNHEMVEATYRDVDSSSLLTGRQLARDELFRTETGGEEDAICDTKEAASTKRGGQGVRKRWNNAAGAVAIRPLSTPPAGLIVARAKTRLTVPAYLIHRPHIDAPPKKAREAVNEAHLQGIPVLCTAGENFPYT